MRTYHLPALLALTLACTANAPAGVVPATADADPGDTAANLDAATAGSSVDAPDASVADATTADSAVDTAADTAADAKLPVTFGLQPAPLALPAFAKVVDSEAQAVTADALLGHYTVVWFYPAAQTSG